MDKSISKRLRYYGVFRPLAQLPLPLAYRAATAVGRYDAWRQKSSARRAIATGLRRAFPQPAAAVLCQWSTAHMTMLAREVLDVFVMSKLTPASGNRLLNLHPDALATLRAARQADAAGSRPGKLRSQRGVIIAMAHYGRLNMLLLALALAGEKLGMLTMVTDRRNPDLDPVDRVYINRKIKTLLDHIGGRWVTVGDDLRGLYRGLYRGETIVILFDIYAEQRAFEVPFLGGTLSIRRGIQRLAEKTGAAVVYGVAHERGYGIEAELRPLPNDPEGALRAAVVELERDVINAPWLWWQWGVLDYIWSPPK